MFKTLFVTCLLACTSSSNALKYNDVRKDVNYNSSYVLQGAYCFREDVDLSDLTDYFDNDFSYTFNVNGTQSIYAYYYQNSSNFYIDKITYYLNFTCYYDEYYTFDLDFAYAYGGTNYSISYWCDADFSSNSDNAKRFLIYFNFPYYIDSNTYKLWNGVFTQNGNAYNVTYSGWYTFNNSINYSNQINWQVFGNIIIDNNLYTSMGKGVSGANYLYATYYSADEEIVFTQFNVNNEFKTSSRLVYFSGVTIPLTYYNYLSSMGIFDYVYQPVDYDFGDVIFSVIDAPIYMLSQLFSFELFGIQFYVAFMGIVTIVLICFVLKKII